ncbi:hypothetical protein FAES_3974 [Fibrella aestuarina BUZ 2]|uniref:Uncharacterized protein n=1 Tax=Fibrella aestuarina BUZ 2 TaxID=1166018 RepID=I0KCX2_9BACT|nr:hypothetical protein [Fibrella aestuarina]CCH01975.1 hypothetical protein FAES_3974 [Fibrella aestuarina BUZ 2]
MANKPDYINLPMAEVLELLYRQQIRTMAYNAVIIQNQAVIVQKLESIQRHLNIAVEKTIDLSESSFYQSSLDCVDEVTDEFLEAMLDRLIKQKAKTTV